MVTRSVAGWKAQLLTKRVVSAWRQAGRAMSRYNLVLGRGIPRPVAPKVSGMLEVIAPEDGFVLETRLPSSRRNGLRRTDAVKEQKNRQKGRLHVFGPQEEVVIEPVQTMSRMGGRNETTSRSYTPSKRILLCTAKSSLEKQNDLARISKTKNPKAGVRLHDHIHEEADVQNHNDEQLKTDLCKLNHEAEAKTESEVNDETEKNSKNVEKTINVEDNTAAQGKSVAEQNTEEKPPDSSDDENSHEQSDNEMEKRIAPLELMGEFLKAIMERKYSLAKKLCQMILIYEPENPEAKQFIPLIEKKLLLENDGEDKETDGGSSDDTEEDTSSSDNNETESEASSEESD